MARIRTRPIRWPEKDEVSNYKDLRRGAADDAYWDEDELVDFPKPGKRRGKKRRGCPENNFKAHVYVWITETRYFSKWGYFGLEDDKTRDYYIYCKTCCGCGHVSNIRYDW